MFKRALCLAVLAATTFTPAFAAEIGKPAPAFTTKDINGNEQSLEAYKGKIVVLEWNNPGCPFVKKHYESNNMQGLQSYVTGKGVVWLTVNSSATGKQGAMDSDQARVYLSEHKSAPSAYILDPAGTIGRLYDAKTTPHMYVVDANGNLAYQGAIDDKSSVSQTDIPTAKNYVRAAVDSLLAGNKVETPQTKAYGCSVKYE